MRRALVACCAALELTSGRALAQLTQEWITRIPAGTSDYSLYGRSVLLPDDSVVVATAVAPTGTTRDVILTRIAANGATLWTTNFAPSGNFDTPTDLSFDAASGELLLASDTRAVGSMIRDARVSRFDAQGNVIWTQVYGVAPFNELTSYVRVDASGVVWLAGRTITGGGPSIEQGFVASFTAAGAPLTSVVFPQSTGFSSIGMESHPAGGIAVVYDAGTAGGGTETTYRIDSAGNVLWSGARPGWVLSGVRRIVCDAAGNVFVCGRSGYDASVAKYAAGGNLLWARTHVAGAFVEANLSALAVDAQGDVVAVGGTFDAANYDMRTLALRYDASGNLEWVHVLAPSGFGDWLADVVLDVAGNATAVGGFSSQGFLLGYERDGSVRSVTLPPWPAVFLQCLAAGERDVVAAGFSGTDTLVTRWHDQAVPFCAGDGGGTPCPCGNTSATYDQAGCRYNASNASHLGDHGIASVGSDSLVLEVRGAPSSGPVIFVQGDQRANGGAGVLYGDGLLCVAGNITRLGSPNASVGVARLGTAGTPRVSALGHVTAPGVYTYQAIHRSPASFCTPATMGTSNGLEVTWSP